MARPVERRPAEPVDIGAVTTQVTGTVRSISARNSQITILIAHRLSTIMHANTIFVLEKGSIVAQGTHEQLLVLRGLYYAMWRQQIGERPPPPVTPDAPGSLAQS